MSGSVLCVSVEGKKKKKNGRNRAVEESIGAVEESIGAVEESSDAMVEPRDWI